MTIAFGLQNVVKDLISGVFMLVEDQFGVGDFVDMKEASGTVEAIGLRITTLRDDDGNAWYVRNGEMVRVGNYSQGGTGRPPTTRRCRRSGWSRRPSRRQARRTSPEPAAGA